MQARDETRFRSLTQALDSHNQALANAVFQHAEQRRVEIEKDKLEKASRVAPPSWFLWHKGFCNSYFGFLLFFLWLSIHLDILCSKRVAASVDRVLCWFASHECLIYKYKKEFGTWKDHGSLTCGLNIHLVLATGYFVLYRMLCSLGSVCIRVNCPFKGV